MIAYATSRLVCKEKGLTKSETCRERAQRTLSARDGAKDGPSRKRYVLMVAAWLDLAEEQDWLDGQVSPIEK